VRGDRTAGTADHAVQLASQTHPDVVVVDPRLPEIDAAALVAKLRAGAPDARVLVLSYSGTTDLSIGADGYTRKTFRPHELIDAVIAATAARPRQ